MVELLLGDITAIKADAVVNAANRMLAGGGGVDGAIHRAGGPVIMAECRQIIQQRGFIETGQVVSTSAGNLEASYVLHTVGPVYDPSQPGLMNRQLAMCYTNALRLAVTLGCRSVAFPNISTGVYGFPKQSAALVATRTVEEYLGATPAELKIFYVCYDEENYRLYSEILR